MNEDYYVVKAWECLGFKKKFVVKILNFSPFKKIYNVLSIFIGKQFLTFS